MKTRRKNGEGNITQLKDGTFKVRMLYTSPDGRKKDRQKRAKTYEEAEKYLAQFRREAEQAKKISTSTIDKFTLEEYVKEFFLPWKMKYLKPQSYRRVESTFLHHIFPKHGQVSMQKLSTVMIESFLEELHENGFSHSTVKKVHDGYKSLYKFAVTVRKDIHPQDNPTLGVMMIPENKFYRKEIKWLTEEEICIFAEEAARKFKTGSPAYKYGVVFLFLMNTGLREGELRALNKTDIDLENRLMFIDKSVNVVVEKRKDGTNAYSKELTTPKTRNSVRYVPLNDEAVYYAQEIFDTFIKSDLFVHNEKGSLLDSGTLHKQFNSILRSACLAERGLHTLRHTFVSALYRNGVDIVTIAEIIGDTAETVKKTYLHLDNATKMKALQKVNIIENSQRRKIESNLHNVVEFVSVAKAVQ